MARRRKKKSWVMKCIAFLFLIGILVCLAFFRKEITQRIQPLIEKPEFIKEKERREVVLYFSDQGGDYLVEERRTILRGKEMAEEARALIVELIKGPRERLAPTLPPKTQCLSVMVNEKGLATVNFNLSLVKDHPGGSSAEILTAYSIVHTLTKNYQEIKRVRILVNGKPIETLSGHLSLKSPLSPNPHLVKRP